MFADIIPITKMPLNKPQAYTYKCGDLSEQVCIGQLVNIPLQNRTTTGVIASLSEEALPNINYKKISDIIEKHPIINEIDLKLFALTAAYYHASLGLLLKQGLPDFLKRKTRPTISTLENINSQALEKEKPIKSKGGQNPLLIIGALKNRQEHYFKIISEVLLNKQQALFLVPEIMLIPQTLKWLEKTFPQEKIILLHSSLTKTKKWLNWRQAQTGYNSIFLGTRSAVFSSWQNLGAIIMDEEYDLSYKQWDMNPRYDARRVAEYKSKLYNAQLIMGSAAPAVASYFKAQKKYYNKIVVSSISEKKIESEIIDMRDELHKGNYSILAEQLEEKIKQTLNNQKQVILFVNRRAASTFVMCRDCGLIMRCPNCQKALVEYNNKTLSCTSCSLKMSSPTICPKCHSPKIKGFGLGVEKVEQKIKDIFPATRVARLDTVASLKDAQKKYQEFERSKIDIIIGTQTALRLISPNLKLVAALNIDSILNFPDWRTDEKAWHILQQIVNRDDGAEAIIQTYNPDNKLLQLIKNPWDNIFYEQELHNRRALNYPPFAQMIKLICRSDDYEFLQQEVARQLNYLKKILPPQNIIGPITPVNEKIREFWQRHIIIKINPHQNREQLKKILQE